MKKTLLILSITIPLFITKAAGQQNADYSKIDMMLIRGEIIRVIDTCRQILTEDTLNAEIYSKMGLAYQNLLPDDKSFDCFLKAATITPGNNNFKYMLARSYYSKGKMNQAFPLLEELCSIDSLNWLYAYYLTSIYMQDRKYDESIKVYNRFYKKDSSNYIILDKLGFARLRKEEFDEAIAMYNRSLAINTKNVNALKNLSFLYASTHRVDTALQLLTSGIKIDPDDMDLYVRRAALNYSLNYTKRALDDYLKILKSGDSTFLYLKRAGIGYTYNLQPKQAVIYLNLAYKKDSSDIETMDHLARNYHKLNDLKKSVYYYNRIIKVLSPINGQLGISFINLAEELKNDGRYREAIDNYLKGQKIRPDMNINMIIANIYDEKLNDIPNAIRYYQLFLDGFKNSKMQFQPEYVESIRKRLEYIKTK
jgi:tetratricopeptide (TPR) repeat protein